MSPLLRNILLLIAFFIIAGVVLSQAKAQPGPCASREAVLRTLQEKFGEEPTQRGRQGGLMAELTESADGSWSLIASSPEGVTCIIASGREWERLSEPPLPGKGA